MLGIAWRCLLVFLAGAAAALAAVPPAVHYQGRLLNAQSVPVTVATPFVFRLYAQPAGGAALFTESQTITPDASGDYMAQVGRAGFPGVDFNQPLWLEVQVGGEVMSPRHALTASPYALRASTANAVAWTGVTGVPAGFADGVDDAGLAGPNSVTSSHVVDGSLTDADISPTANIATGKINGGVFQNEPFSFPAPLWANSDLTVGGSLRLGGSGSPAKLGIAAAPTSASGPTLMQLGNHFGFRVVDDTFNTLVLDRFSGGWIPLMSFDRARGRIGINVGPVVPDATLHTVSAEESLPGQWRPVVSGQAFVPSGLGGMTVGGSFSAEITSNSTWRPDLASGQSGTMGLLTNAVSFKGGMVWGANVRAVSRQTRPDWVAGLEIDVDGDVSPGNRYGLAITDSNNTRGESIEGINNMIWLSHKSGQPHLRWKNGIMFGYAPTSAWPIRADGTLINADPGTALNGITLHNVVFSGDAFSSNGFYVKGNGRVGIGINQPESALQILGGYLQLSLTPGAPPAADCDAPAERGRMKIDSAAGVLYICADAGWIPK